ncbi:MAG: hypothetical protein O3A53_17430 [Acidobacteria bacterium]|nr:hypothetical protein [Acidobacteriota bacterium]MDA1236570.1 hypothetical protein [Acidobacteriota bacterium]
MATFFVQLKVAPVPGSPQAEIVKGAYAYCWIIEASPSAAFNKACFYVTKVDWEIKEVIEPAVEVKEEACQESELTRDGYQAAQEQGLAVVYEGWSLDGKTAADLAPLEQATRFDLNKYLSKRKQLANKGRCLHFESGERCSAIIKAHSIQKSGPLAVIASEGHVYTPSVSGGKFDADRSQIVIEKRGIGKLSTFLGFCEKHDNEVFGPIDTQPLIPTGEQVLLYAYRSICREFFVKENALALADSQLALWPPGHPFTVFEDIKAGSARALTGLRRHKENFDASLKYGRFDDVEYVLFVSRQGPTHAFSGLIYPHFDFLGRKLQALEDPSTPMDLITFCSAPLRDGWGFLFAWHKASAPSCREFLSSLAQGESVADAAFRLVISNCENVALAPAWWEGLEEDKKAAIRARVTEAISPFAPIEPDYLTKGLEGLSGWEFTNVLTNVPAGERSWSDH